MRETPTLEMLHDVLNDLNAISPGSGKIHEHNTRRGGIQAAIQLYGKPGKDRIIAQEYRDAVEYLVKWRVEILKEKGLL